jgi:redox-regulated HSP33 family molecular chaperone
MINDDCVYRFLFDDLDICGAIVNLRSVWRQMLDQRDYPAPVACLLGEMTATTLLLGDKLKQPGRLTIQLRGNGALSLLVIDCNEQLQIRGMAKCTAAIEHGSAAELLGDGQLQLVLDMPSMREPYQSIVPLAGDSIAEIFEHYLAQSEQLPARLFLAASADGAAGLFLQRLPTAEQRDADGWTRIEALAATAAAASLWRRDRAPLSRPDRSSTTVRRTGKRCVRCCFRSAAKKSMRRCASRARCSSRTTSAIATTVSTRRPSTNSFAPTRPSPTLPLTVPRLPVVQGLTAVRAPCRDSSSPADRASA